MTVDNRASGRAALRAAGWRAKQRRGQREGERGREREKREGEKREGEREREKTAVEVPGIRVNKTDLRSSNGDGNKTSTSRHAAYKFSSRHRPR